MTRPLRLVTILFGPLGDTLMALALFDDIVRLRPSATLVVLTRRNAEMIRALAAQYPGVTVREIPRGVSALALCVRILFQPGSTLLMLGLASAKLSWPLRLFLRIFALVPGNKTIGFYDSVFDVEVEYRVPELIIENFRRMLPHVVPEWKETSRAPVVHLPQVHPKSFPFRAGEYVVLHLFGISIAHVLPPERWRALLEHVVRTHAGLGLVLTGTAKEPIAMAEVAQGLPVHMATNLTIPELVWVVDNAALYVGIDTGVTHIAGLLQQKSLVVRHCSDPSWRPTYNPYARAVFNSTHCNPGDPARCLLIEEEGRMYRRCAYDLSAKLLEESVDLALSRKEKQVPLFAGSVDEGRR